MSRATVAVHQQGSLAFAVGTSIAIPGLAPPLIQNGDFLVDGGLLENVPVGVMRRVSQGRVFTVDVGNVTVLCSGPKGQFKFGDIHFRIFRAVNGSLIELAGSQAAGAKRLSIAVAEGERIYVWVYGFYFTQAGYDMTVELQ